MKKLSDAKIDNNTKVFVRVDLDVPISDGKIQDENRLKAALHTLKYLKDHGAQITIAGHMGRPKNHEPELSTTQLKPFFDKFFGDYPYKLLENLRYDPREEQDSKEYAKEIVGDCNMYVNESFATSHREHTSIVAVPRLVPGYAGLNFQKEIESVNQVLQDPKRPLTAVVGGAKIESKKPVIKKFLEICDNVLVGGKIGFDWDESVPANLHLPTDYEEGKKDIGMRTAIAFADIIKRSKTVIWAGPMGLFEEQMYAKGTQLIAEAIIQSGAYSIIGGGDTASAVASFGLEKQFSFVSTGGGALLELIVNGTLPGIQAISL